MKRLLVLNLIILFTISTSSFAQVQKYKKNQILNIPEDISTVLVYKVNGIDQRFSYSYNSNGFVVNELCEQLNNGIWENYEKNSYTYDSKGNKLSTLNETYIDNSWIPSYKYSYSYDSKGNLLTELLENYTNNSWVNSNRKSYIYNTKDKILEDLSEVYVNGDWVFINKNTNTYDNNGNLIIYISEKFKEGQWVVFSKGTNTFDKNDNLYESYGYYYDNVNKAYHSTYLYDTNGKRIKGTTEILYNSKWELYNRNTYSYDLKGNVKIELVEKFVFDQWENSSRYTTNYDTIGNKISYSGEVFKDNQWQNEKRFSYNYNNNGNLLKGISEDFKNGSWINSKYDAFFYVNEKYKIFIGFKIEITYKDPTSINIDAVPNQLSLSISPNPASDYIIINVGAGSKPALMDEIEIFNIFGEKTTPSNLSGLTPLIAKEGNFKIDVSNLSPGVYFIRIGDRFEKFIKL
jgi:hypothetical protein